MADFFCCPISGESPEEERVNYLTHLFGLLLSLIGLPILIVCISQNGDFWHVTGCLIYGVTLVALYASSTYYHNCQKVSHKRILQIVDHACIYLLIAGTYTPLTVGPLRENGGWILLYTVWAIAAFGICLKIVAINRFEILSLIAYLAMGWMVVLHFPTLMEETSLSAIIWMIAGGLAYSLGTIFFIWEAIPFNHAIWHLFVLSGSACHYCSILDMFGYPLI